MNTDSDTIAAIATAGSEGCISIVRLSGPDALNITEKISRSAKKPTGATPNTVLYAHIVGSDGKDIDEVLLLILRAPKSYTCEEMVEIQGHGGRISAARIMRRCLDAGARPAEPGEFTKRAFLNGRLDLLQAEAVQDLVKAQSEAAANMALEQLEGGLSTAFNEIYDALIHLLADLEATLDFSEEQLLLPVYDEIKTLNILIMNKIERLLKTWPQGHILREGASIAIIGRPNVGKSTLLNRLLDKERAIVSPIPGTTRDTIEESILLHGIPLRLTDTAGMRTTECHVEREGIERTRKTIQQADLILHVLDASQPLDDEMQAFWRKIQQNKLLYVVNKTDIKKYNHSENLPKNRTYEGSLLNNEDVIRLKNCIYETITSEFNLPDQPHAVISERHRDLLQLAQRSLKQADQLMKEQIEEKTIFISTHVRDAIEQIGKITGRVYYEELLDQLFAGFCIGK
ncbi:MAG: tRNA uridine-5-carboxymethylaminomethyl(34) synthesis GTPase MnmE [Kiritimatiellae bacterium]|nr:tRNA uridine-5-carboxymethylaminomethyl(34) synthesis GTPase MnmE [Kiritimatiellia bacterium]